MKNRFNKAIARPAFATRPAMAQTQPEFRFTFDGIDGAVFPGGFIKWNGGSFQIEAAGPELRAAIERDRKSSEAAKCREERRVSR